jgi:hypothetical protein
MNRPASILPQAPHKPKGFRHISAVLFSRHGMGKTSLFTQFKNCLAIDLEGGTRLLETTATEPATWEALEKTIEALEMDNHNFDCISIDTADRAFDLCEKSVCAELGVGTIGDAARGKGWAMLKTRWRRFVWRVVNLRIKYRFDESTNKWVPCSDGRKILPFFMCHEKLIPMTERRRGVAIETGRSQVSVNLPNTAKNILLPAVDFVFHLFMDEEGQRFLRTQALDTPEFRIESKGRGIPAIHDSEGNTVQEERCLPPIIPATFADLARAFDETFNNEGANNV